MTHRVKLVDDAGESGRSTATLLASLAARLGTLHVISGGIAIGSLTAGFAELGRAVSATPDGARVRRALERGRPGANGHAIWESLRIGDWASAHPPAPILDQLRNDVALLLADDLEETLEQLPIPGESTGARGSEDVPSATFLDFAVGYWAFSREVTFAIEALAAPTMGPPSGVTRPAVGESDGPLLR